MKVASSALKWKFVLALAKTEKLFGFSLPKSFSVLAKARTNFHLDALEATFIKTLKPILCRQKEFVYSLQILR